MENVNNDIVIALAVGEQEKEYRLEKIFPVGDAEQLYCSFVALDDDADVQLLKCSLVENDDSDSLSLSIIETDDEYNIVVDEYNKLMSEESYAETREDFIGREDFLTLYDDKGVSHDFIAHFVFDDSETNRSYIAVQAIDNEGNISEEIEIFRVVEENDNYFIKPFTSAMEYDNARAILIDIIEGSIENN